MLLIVSICIIYNLKSQRDSICLFLRNKQNTRLLYVKKIYRVNSGYFYKLSVLWTIHFTFIYRLNMQNRCKSRKCRKLAEVGAFEKWKNRIKGDSVLNVHTLPFQAPFPPILLCFLKTMNVISYSEAAPKK